MDGPTPLKLPSRKGMVISEELRVILYPLGLISTLCFTLRFLVQWLQSERAGRSIVSRPFWWISLLGNGSLLIHSLIQGQYFICLVQGVNGVIAARNLNLMQPKTWTLSTVLLQLGAVFIFITLLFFFFSPEAWWRTPVHAMQTALIAPSYGWNLIGFLGVVLFASRFWMQWIFAELTHTSQLPSCFWWLSLVGACLSILYFGAIQDYINLVGPLFGLIPYARNLILLRRSHGTL